jgi:hypothetical protein
MGLSRSTFYDPAPLVAAPGEVLVRMKAICDEFECYGLSTGGCGFASPGRGGEQQEVSDSARLLHAAQGDGLGAMNTANTALEAVATELERDFALEEREASEIEAALADPEQLARQLVERFSPKWLFGSRACCPALPQVTPSRCSTAPVFELITSARSRPWSPVSFSITARDKKLVGLTSPMGC